MDYIKLAQEFIGEEGKGRDHRIFTHPCPLCKELRDFAEFLKNKLESKQNA